MRRRFSFTLLGTASAFFLPLVTHAAINLSLNPIVPKDQCGTSAPDWGSVLATIQIAINDLAVVATILITFYLAWAGVSFMLAPVNPEAKTKARTRIVNAIVGLLVTLGAWLLINSLMAVIYNTAFDNGLPWNQILADGGDQCIQTHTEIPSLPGSFNPGANASGSTGGTLPQNGTGACSPSSVQSAAAAGGYNISASEASVLACLAKPESACGQNTTGATTPGGQSTSAAGPWQNLLGANDQCHSLNIPACGNLNCSAAYNAGHVKPDPQSQQLAAQCQAAANNLTCSAAAAACLVQANHGSYGAWTADPRSSAQKACVANGG